MKKSFLAFVLSAFCFVNQSHSTEIQRSLVFLNNPPSTALGAFLPTIRVAIKGPLHPGEIIQVTVQDQYGLVQGKTTVPVVNGVAEFTNLYFLQGATGYQLTANANGFKDAHSSKFDIFLSGPASLSLFGLDIHSPGSAFPTDVGVNFGIQRLWDSGVAWAQVSPEMGTWNWKMLDTYLSHLYQHNFPEAIYTISSVPTWASSKSGDGQCRYNKGSCDLPSDLNPDGSGTNQTWIDFVIEIVSHANDSEYLKTHAHIRYWEVWNEPDQNPLFTGPQVFLRPNSHTSINATYAQVLRMTEDLRCIVKGDSVVHISGKAIACADVHYLRYGIDPSALILMPSFHLNDKQNTTKYMQNFLYCHHQPKSLCNIPAGEDWGGEAIDAVNYHSKITTSDPENVLNHIRMVQSTLRPREREMPFFNDESGWGDGVRTPNNYTYEAIQAAFIPRYYLAQFQNIVATGHYAWENYAEDGLYDPDTNTVTQPGIAYNTVFNWLDGAQLTQPCKSRVVDGLTIWTCRIAKGTEEFLALWDATLPIAEECDPGTNTCPTSEFPLALLGGNSKKWQSYEDYTGTKYPVQNGEVPIGAQTILLSTQQLN
jgi:hypothetical protein